MADKQDCKVAVALPYIDASVEAEAQRLLNDGKIIHAIKHLRECAGLSILQGQAWVHSHGLKYERPTIPCPYCKKPLRSPLAKQCFHCGMDWHDAQNVVLRGSRAM